MLKHAAFRLPAVRPMLKNIGADIGRGAKVVGGGIDRGIGRIGGFKKGITDVSPEDQNWFTRLGTRLGGNTGTRIARLADSTFLGGVSPQGLIPRRFGRARDIAKRINPMTAALSGSAVGVADAGLRGGEAIANRYDDAAGAAADAIARNAGLSVEQRDDIHGRMRTALEGGGALDFTALTGIDQSAMTPAQRQTMRKMIASTIQNALATETKPGGRSRPLHDFYELTRKVSPGATMTGKLGKGVVGAIKNVFGEPYESQDMEADVNAYLGATKGDPTQGQSRFGQSVSSGVSGLMADAVNSQLRGGIGKARKNAWGYGLTNNLERDIGDVAVASPQAVSEAIFSSGGMPLGQLAENLRRIGTAKRSTEASVYRTLAEKAYDDARSRVGVSPRDVPAVESGALRAPDAINDGLLRISRGMGHAADTIERLPDDVDVAKQSYRLPGWAPRGVSKQAPPWLAPFLNER